MTRFSLLLRRWSDTGMGLFKKLASAFGWLRHEVRILVVGLDNSGKTTLVNHIKPKKVDARRICHPPTRPRAQQSGWSCAKIPNDDGTMTAEITTSTRTRTHVHAQIYTTER